jgi:26S proteasome regulatory subunit N6
VAKATTANIVRTVLNITSGFPGTERLQIDLCKESIQWCKDTDRSFLRHRIETRLYSLLFQVKEYQPALAGLTALLSEVKRLDDKPLLVEIQLLESRIHHALRNIPKARGALTAARTNANAIYCPPRLQAEIDMMSGILHSEEHDYKTAYSYFFESFEGFNSLDAPEAVTALKYMLLCKIMTHHPEEVAAIVQGKTALRYPGADVDAMRAVAKAHSERDLRAFEDATKRYPKELVQDPIIHAHLSELYNTLLEQNLCRLIEPFSRVEISHIAKLIDLPVPTVEKKLSNMILDHKFDGILDQGSGTLIVFNDPHLDKTYPTSLETIQTLSKIVDGLYEKAGKLS